MQEYLTTRYVMNETAVEERKSDCFAGIDLFGKGSRLFYILRFMYSCSRDGATAIFTHLKFFL